MKLTIALSALLGTCLALPKPIDAGAEDLAIPNPTDVLPEDLAVLSPTKVTQVATFTAAAAPDIAAPVRPIDDPNWGKWPPSTVFPPMPPQMTGAPFDTVPYEQAFTAKWPNGMVVGGPPPIPTLFRAARDVDSAEDLRPNLAVGLTTSPPKHQPTTFSRITVSDYVGTTWAGAGYPPESQIQVYEVTPTGMRAVYD